MAHLPKMSLNEFSFLSKNIGRQVKVNILLPTASFSNNSYKAKRPYKVLWLLHGKTDDYTTWLRNSIIEEIARDEQIAVVMPDAGNSFYTDMEYGPNYYSYLTEELPSIMYSLFPLSSKKADNYIAGLSMGGYGALKIGLQNPEKFSAIGAFSSAADIVSLVRNASHISLTLSEQDKNNLLNEGYDPESVIFQRKADIKLFNSIFGNNNQIENTNNDLFYLIKKNVNIPIFLTCGTEDGLFKYNDSFYHEALKQNANITFTTMPGGHEWNVWNRSIIDYFAFLHHNKLI